MGIGNDSFELKKMFDGVNEAPTTAPTKPITKPDVKPSTPRPSKPRNPALPKPGVHPKPKAKNRDVDLFLKQRGLHEKKKLNEGQFSWLLPDGTPIYSDHDNEGTIYMLDDKGNKWAEDDYEGYGEFGGKDYFALAAEMNGHAAPRRSDSKDIRRNRSSKDPFIPATNDELDARGTPDRAGDETLRGIGIDIFHSKERETNPDIKVPRFTTDPNAKYDSLPDPEDDPNQGWFQEEEMDYEEELEMERQNGMGSEEDDDEEDW